MSRINEILHCYSEKGICLYDTIEINGIGQHIHYTDGLCYSCEWLNEAAKGSASDIAKIQHFFESIPQPPEMNAANVISTFRLKQVQKTSYC